jgi:hypothetical protein
VSLTKLANYASGVWSYNLLDCSILSREVSSIRDMILGKSSSYGRFAIFLVGSFFGISEKRSRRCGARLTEVQLCVIVDDHRLQWLLRKIEAFKHRIGSSVPGG